MKTENKTIESPRSVSLGYAGDHNPVEFSFEPGPITLKQTYVTPEMLLDRLKDIIEQNYKEHRDPAFYSNALAYGLRSLNILCKKYTGKTVFMLVQERVLIEAERLLAGTPLSTKLIAFELGYLDPPYFCKVFKKMKGAQPGEWRRQKRPTLSS